jgi:UDP-N-acetylglucosamine--N-acetylmuramyl-(pentapeptide) pyrophosphoryl-undecaprenol N-acetylglucosamine transferase
VAAALVDRGLAPEKIHFVGSTRGMEATLVPEAGFSITLLAGRGVPRRLSWTAVTASAGLARAVVAAVVLLIRRRPSVVLSVGGYASLPCAVAAVLLRIPLVLEEQNSVPGLANRLMGRFARSAAVAFPGTALPRAVVTGRPVAADIEAVDRSAAGRRRARAELGVAADGILVGVTSGSLGARSVNRAVAELATRWANRPDRVLYHVIGRRDFDSLTRPSGTGYVAVEYEQRMSLLLAAADVMVSRAGGMVAELTLAGVPSVLVPLPNAPGDHQTHNALALQEAGAAIMLADGDCSGQALDRVLTELIDTPGRLESMSSAAAALGRPGAAQRVAELVEAAAGRGRPT